MSTNTFSKLDVDIDLIIKYDRPGPRYTSYPTAPYFNDSIRGREFLASLGGPQSRSRDLSLYFHIPFCAKLCYFCGCTMQVTRSRPRIREYIDYLIREMAVLSAAAGRRLVKQIHWGGGTPSYLTPDEIRLLAGATCKVYTIAADAEISVEIDPRQVTEAHYRALRDSGFNRISMGVQDFYEKTQRAINRIQPEALTVRYVQLGRQLGFESVNLDLIYGLPHQTAITFADTIEKIIAIRPDRIALFNFAYVPWMKRHHRVIDETTLPAPMEKLQILKLAIERLSDAGYVFIGMDHFALPEDSLSRALQEKSLYRNFQGYSTHANCDLIAHGMSGISQTADVYAQNSKDFQAYYNAIGAGRAAIERGYRLDRDDLLRREVITRLMCDFSLRFADIETRFQIDFRQYFAEELAGLEMFLLDGLLTLDDRGIQIHGMGKLLIRNIVMAFDKYLKLKRNTQFSKTI